MTDTTTLAPTDAELESLWRIEASKSWSSTSDMRASFARAVLAKWGAPAPASGEPAAYRLKDDEATKHYGKDVYVYYTPNEFKTPAAFKYLEPLYTAPPAQEAQLNPDMSVQELRLHMGELTTDEVLVARAAIRWANTYGITAAQKETPCAPTPSP